MTAVAPPREDAPADDATPFWGRATSLRWVTSIEWWLLGVIAVLGAVARSGGLSDGTLYRDDAWVALTTRVPLGTAARMVVTTPGFVLGERVWIGWFPHTLLADQLPTFLASVAGIVAVGRLARWWGMSAPAALVAAGIVATSFSDIQYATRIKPYAFDLLGACLILWLAERVRRHGARNAPWLAAASVCVCCISLTPVPLVVGVWVALGVDALVSRRMSWRLAASGAATVLGLAALWFAVRGGVSPRLRHSWDGNYLVVTSPHGLVHSAHTIVDGLVRGIGATTPALGPHGLGTVDRVALLALFCIGLIRWRRQLLGISAIAAAVVLSIPSLVPLGTGRTDAYLYPAIAMVLAEGAALTWHLVRRGGTNIAAVALVACVVFSGLVALDRVTHRPAYPGGDFAAVAAVIHRSEVTGHAVIVGGTARWPWTYYDVGNVRIVYSDRYNNGYTTLSDNPMVIVIPGSAIEGGYGVAAREAALRVRGRCAGVIYVEADDWPSMPSTLLAQLVTTGHLYVVAGPTVVHGYRYWTLAPTATCPLGRGPLPIHY